MKQHCQHILPGQAYLRSYYMGYVLDFFIQDREALEQILFKNLSEKTS